MRRGDYIQFAASSLVRPYSAFMYQISTGSLFPIMDGSSLVHMPLEMKKIHYTAHNGKKAAIWLVMKKGLELNSNTPVYMYGYGGFDLGTIPYYDRSLVPWLALFDTGDRLSC